MTYEELYENHSDAEIIVNTTPVGMYPDIFGCPVSLSKFERLSGVIDVVYNPINTTLVKEARAMGVSAESGLYCRVITEGLFGLRPVGFSSFELKPSLPSAWDTMSLKKVKAFGDNFDITVTRRADGRLDVTVVSESGNEKKYIVKEGQTVKFRLS